MPRTRGNLLKCREPNDSRAPAYATAAVIGGAFVFSMALCWPGGLSYDSVVQLLEGRTAAYSGWHPPVMSWLLGLSDALIPGAGLFVLADALVFFASLLSLLWLVPRPSWAAPAVAALCAMAPQFALYQGIVWKDVLFANLAVAGFVAQAHLAACWGRKGCRYGLLAISSFLLVLAALTRQNGAILVLAGAASLFWISLRRTGNLGGAAFRSAGVLSASLVAWIAATAALDTRLIPEAGISRQLKRLELYDLIGGLTVDPKLNLTHLQRRDPELPRLMRRDGVRLYSPSRSDMLAQSAPLQAALERAPDAMLQTAWTDFIVHRTADYLRVRGDAFRWVLLTPDISVCVPYVVGLRGPRQAMDALGLRIRVDRRDRWADAYGRLFVHTPVFSHAAFALLAILELAFLFWRRRTIDIPMMGMLGGAIVFASSFFFISLACDYRYLYALDLAALVALIYIALHPQPS